MKRLALRFRRAVLTAVTTFAVLVTSLLCSSNAFAWVRMAPLRRSTLIWAAIAGLVITLVMAGDSAATPEPGEAEPCRRLDSQLNINEVDWQPNGDWIVFAREGDGLGNTVYLWKVRADGSGLQQLTFRGVAETPRWSPDGSRIAFVQANRAWLINSQKSAGKVQTRASPEEAARQTCRQKGGEAVFECAATMDSAAHTDKEALIARRMHHPLEGEAPAEPTA